MRGDEKSVYDLPPILRDGRVDGIVLTGSINSDVISVLKALKVPYVILGAYSSNITDSSVNILPDMRMTIGLIVKTLKENGKKRIAYFTEAPDNYSEQEYLSFFKSAMIENHLPICDELIYCGAGPFSGAIKTIEKVFMQPSLPFDSIISPNFRTAQEISHLVMSYYGIGKIPPVTIGTLPPFNYYRLPVPAIYCGVTMDKVAYEGMDILNDFIAGKIEYTSKKIMLSPEIEE
jgi:DNA-binding LacI/PurR family transcriptional regulator